MSDSEKLRALATWFDIHDAMKNKQLFDNEVQIDLRAMADRIEHLHKPVVSGKRPSLNEVAQAADKYLEKVGRVDRMDIIKWDFIEGIAWAIEYYQAAGVCSGEGKTT